MRETQNTYRDPIDSLEHSYSNFWYNVLDTKLIPLVNTLSITDLSFKNIDLIILSGGGSVPNKYLSNVQEKRIEQKNRDMLEAELLKYALLNKIPIIGICRGMQYINCLLGGTITNLVVSHSTGVDHEIVTKDGNTYTVNSFHNDGVLMSNLSNELLSMAVDQENPNLVEAFRHRSAKVLGIQWHPERKFSNFNGYNYTLSLIKEFIQKI